MVRGDAPVRSSNLKTSVSWLNEMVKAGRGPDQAQSAGGSVELAQSILISSLELKDELTQLGTTSVQLNSAWRSVPVRTSVVKAERLLGRASGSCGAMGPCEAKAEPGHGKRLRELVFDGETAKKQLERLTAGLEQLVAKGCKGTSGTISANPWQPIAHAVTRPLSL
ncbi:hypothetical protein F2Q68_00021753 [Brassica cretica]|uniref:Uncharacterized protein n=1 Tax=Brassica cretica TaxID=69181 RepID=A0A8S9FQ13_BRACR|nr:hypothetical protein F2Q68_00021753 [Brassica cretica]